MILNKLKLNPKNPRTIKKESYEKLKKSLKEFPQMLELRPIIYDDDFIVLGGNMRLRALQELVKEGLEIKDSYFKKASDLTEEQKKEFIIKDNIPFGEWDDDALANEWSDLPLDEWGLDTSQWETEDNDSKNVRNKLSEKFLVPPFSVLDTRQGYWQDRKRIWKDLGIDSGDGRDMNLTYSSSTDFMSERIRVSGGGTSIFDPVLCEIMYKWFTPENGTILDPFAGGSVRGIVAGYLGYRYFGNDLSDTQIIENRKQASEILTECMPVWTIGDSMNIDKLLHGEYDYIFSCPPYFDLEVYSEKEGELSNMEYEEFLKNYGEIIKKCVSMLKNNRFATFVITEIRDEKGYYRNFVPETIKAFENAGMKYYNEMILVNTAGSLPLRVGKQFQSNRKIGRTHQNVLNFYKGDIAEIRNVLPEIEISLDITDQ